MIFKGDLPIIQAAEAVARVGTIEEVLGMLRRLSPLDFGRMLLEMPTPGYPALSAMLPRMAKTEVQTAWTGSSGYDMFRQTKDFVLRLELYVEAICRRPLRGATILDYGCGWGRLARMMAYYTDPDNIYCLDPLKDSINICKEDGILGHVRLSDYYPAELPVGEARFDLVYAYSVFTHTSLRATTTALNTIRRYMKPDGLFVITVRPVEVWGLSEFGENTEANRGELIAAFERTGFSFLENPHMLVDGESVYGVTAISPDWISRSFPNWRIVRRDRGEDHSQHILVLQPC